MRSDSGNTRREGTVRDRDGNGKAAKKGCVPRHVPTEGAVGGGWQLRFSSAGARAKHASQSCPTERQGSWAIIHQSHPWLVERCSLGLKHSSNVCLVLHVGGTSCHKQIRTPGPELQVFIGGHLQSEDVSAVWIHRLQGRHLCHHLCLSLCQP